ncbi:MAG TPA: molybdenum cofactor guanylyltransferase [Vicinamibacteria bacterium]
MDVVGFAVAGGRSRRMGRDKAGLAWAGTDLLGHALQRLRAVCRDVRLLSGPERRYADRGVPVIVDPVEGVGSLAALLAGLEASGGPGLFLGVDLPFVPVPFLAHLASLADSVDAVVPVSPRGPEPLCAVYGAACLPPIRRCLAEARLKMTAFWPDVRVCEVGPDELGAFGESSRLFRNLNTPADYAAARAEEP